MIGAMLADFVVIGGVIGEGEMKIPSLKSSTNKHSEKGNMKPSMTAGLQLSNPVALACISELFRTSQSRDILYFAGIPRELRTPVG